MSEERRKFKRLHAPVLCRPLGAALVKAEREVQDISMGGVRVYTDDLHQLGDRLELELFLPGAEEVTLDTEVMWVDPLPKDGPARYEVGLRFIDLSPIDSARLEQVLKED